MPLKAGARVNTPPLEANKIKSYADTPSACCGELHCELLINAIFWLSGDQLGTLIVP